MVVPGPVIESELQLQTMLKLWPHQIFNPLHRAGEQMHASAATRDTAVRFLNHCTTVGTPVDFYFIYLYIYFCFLGPNLQHMEAPRAGVELEL